MLPAVALVGCGKEDPVKGTASLQPPPPKEIVEIVVEDFVGTYDVEASEWGPARLVFLENGVGEYHNTATLGSEVITIKWKIVKKGFVKWECRISGQPFSAVYRHNPDGSITGGMGTFKKIKSPKEAPSKSVEIANPIVEKAIRKQIKKPTGELTEANLEKVTELYLNDTKITDAGLEDLTKLKNLTDLPLSRTKITDAGLKDTAKMQQLTRLSLNYTGITDAGAAELKKAMPKCKIEHSYWE